MKFRIEKETELKAVAEELIKRLGKNDSVLLYGDLGSGKTTFVKYLLPELSVDDEVSSPTFSIVNAYGDANRPIYHIDLYRLQSVKEMIDAGIEEILEGRGLKVIEWPELAESLIPVERGVQRLRFELQPDGSRKIIFL